VGRKVSDGKAFNLTVPAGKAVSDYELYRISGINGVAIGEVAVADTARTLAFEADPAAVYSIHIPSGVNPAPGDVLYWAAPSTNFQDGAVNLQTTPGSGHGGAQPCFFVTESRSQDPDGNYVLRGRVLNGTGTGS